MNVSVIAPPWLEEGGTLPPEPKPGKWTAGMPSPNPKGRPKGIVDRRQKLQNAFADDAVEIARVVIEAAKAGDLQACNIALARVTPTLRPQTERVAFDFDATAPITAQIEAVLTGIAAGALSPDVGKEIISALGTLSDARATADLEARLIVLEQKGTR